MKTNILYFHINNTTGQIFYVGIGVETRASSKRNRNNWWKNTVNKYGYDIIIEETNLSWDEACVLEMYWIKRIGRRDLGLGPLVNLTNGGEGSNGMIVSNETRLKLSIAGKGKNTWSKGKIDSPETREKKRLSKIGNTNSRKKCK